jgi:hypothetical protein
LPEQTKTPPGHDFGHEPVWRAAVIGRIVSLVFTFAAAAVMVTLAVANRHDARLVLDPFNPKAPVVAVHLPFFVYLFTMLAIGVIVGSMATWMSQGKWRRIARTRTQEAMRWRSEAERLTRERDATVASAARGGEPTRSDDRQLAVARS